MKKSFIKKISALFTSLLLCFCNSSIQLGDYSPTKTIRNLTNVKRSNNPFDDTDNHNILDMRSIKLDWFEEGSIEDTYMQYFEYAGVYHAQNDSDDFYFYLDLDNSYNLNLHISTTDYTLRTLPIKSFILPLKSSLDDFVNSRIYIDFNLNFPVNVVSLGSFEEDKNLMYNLSNNLFSSYGYNFFNHFVNLDVSGYNIGNVNISYSDYAFTYLYIVFAPTISFSIPSGTNNLTIPLGKLNIYSESFPHNSVYTNEPDNIYQNGYDVGYQKGLEKGENVGSQNVVENFYGGKTYQEIYNIGYNTGYSQGHNHDADNYIPHLFEGIINIPISVLNGLAPLTFFDLSVIRVIITILAMSVVVWLISYIMSTKG